MYREEEINPPSFYAKQDEIYEDEKCTYCEIPFPLDQLSVTEINNPRIGRYMEYCCLQCEINIKES